MGDVPFEELYQDIGREAVAIADDDLGGKLLVYGEAMQGMVEADVAYVNRRGEIQVVLGTDALQDTVYSLWRRWKEHLGTEQWRAIAYTVENGEFHMDLTYPDAFDEHEIDPRAKAIEKYFGKDKKVLYPRPSA